jgi:hypothetical protein
MKTFFPILVLVSALSQVACSDDTQVQSFASQCSSDALCVQRYQNALNIVGTAAVSGIAQVADANSTPSLGQVPALSLLPASITDTQIKAQSIQIAAQLQKLNAAQGADSGSYAPASLSPEDEVNLGPDSQSQTNGEVIR